MRIAYGVHGYGFGHAARALAVLPRLAGRHELLILAGGEGYRALASSYPVVRLPILRYIYRRRTRISSLLTVRHNAGLMMDLLLAGPVVRMVADALADFGPDVVLSDSEVLAHRAARLLGIPRISFDNFGAFVYCRPVLGGLDRLRAWSNGLGYRRLMGEPERAIVTTFMPLQPCRAGVRVVGPVLRPEVLGVTPTRGEHLLVYVSMGRHEYTPAMERVLRGLDCPVRVYGTSRTGREGNIEYKATANLPFLADLASCRAVFGTTGNQLIGEAIYFRKPILGMPIDCAEQRMNALALSRMGVGMSVARNRVSTALIRSFLEREGEFAAKLDAQPGDGTQDAVEAIDRFAGELVPSRTRSVKSTPAM